MSRRKRSSKLITCVLAIILALSITCPAFAVSYSDTENHWAASLIDKWSNAGVIIGTTTFSPDDALTRGELAMILEEIFAWGEMADNTFHDLTYAADGTTYLTDVPLYAAVLKANAAGVMQGYRYYIRPFDAVTRQEACVIICQAFDIKPVPGNTSFSDDAAISSFAKSSVYAMAKAGYLKDDSSGAFHPQSSFTRAEILSVIDKMVGDYTVLSKRLAEGDITAKYTDIPVTTVPTYASGFVETDAKGTILTKSTGTKDLVIRFWYPKGVKTGTTVPLLINTHGGAWMHGDRTGINSYLVEYMLEHGVAVASLTYRLEQEAIYPYCMYDLQAQIRYLRINAASLGINPNSVGITGNSAGGYWATQMAVTGNEKDHQDPGYVTFSGDNRSISTELSYCGWQYGCANMLTCFKDVDYRIHDYWSNWSFHDNPMGADPALFGTDDITGYSYTNKATGEAISGVSTTLLREIYNTNDTDHELWWLVEHFVSGSPIFWVDKDDPCFFFYHGTNDPLCPVQQAIDMYGALIDAGVEGNEFRLCEGLGHGSYTHPAYYLELLQWMADQAYNNVG